MVELILILIVFLKFMKEHNMIFVCKKNARYCDSLICDNTFKKGFHCLCCLEILLQSHQKTTIFFNGLLNQNKTKTVQALRI